MKKDHPKELQRFILLPANGLRTINESIETQNFFKSLNKKTTKPVRSAVDNITLEEPQMRIIDSIHDNGAKLVEMSPETLAQMRAVHPSIRIIPEVFYYPQRVRFMIEQQLKQQNANVSIKIRVLSAGDNKPVAKAIVVIFTNFKKRIGVQGETNSSGELTLKVPQSSMQVDQLHIYPRIGYWSLLRKRFTLNSGDIFNLTPISLQHRDAVRYFYPNAGLDIGQGVKVGVIDSGVGPHPDLTLGGGQNCVTSEDKNDFTDSDQHGTHVAGIIAARGTRPDGMSGIAPGVTLMAYRVFGKGQQGASNFDIAKAIDQAIEDECDIVNMSLGGGSPDELIMDAIRDAYQNGVISFVATGNDDRSPVSFPASFSLSLAVSAMGRKGTFPPKTTDVNNIKPPLGKDKKNFVAAFSNVGPQVDLIGPGVGIVSTVPGGYLAMSGTSMACPAATGAAAKLLFVQTPILNMPRSQARTEAMIRFLSSQAELLGFGATFEGIGMYK